MDDEILVRGRQSGEQSVWDEIVRVDNFKIFGKRSDAYRRMAEMYASGATQCEIAEAVSYTQSGVSAALSAMYQRHCLRPLHLRHRRKFTPAVIVRRIEAARAEDERRRTEFFENFDFDSKLDKQILKLKREKKSLREIERALRGPKRLSFIAIRNRLEKIENQYREWLRGVSNSKLEIA